MASDHDGHTIEAGPVTVGTCGCSNNFGHTCEEVARLRAENAEIRGDNAHLGSTVTGLRADNVTLRDLLAKALPMSAADELRALTAAATPGPWEAGDVWSWAGCGFMGLGADECTLCARMGDPVWTGKADINGKRMHAHKHRNPHPYAVDHRISGPNGEVAGNYDYEEGGIIDPADLALIVWLVNHAQALADLIDASDALVQPAGWWKGVEQRQEHQLLDRRAVVRDVLAALEADRG